MADKFVFNGTDYTLSRRFDLGGGLGRSLGNEFVNLDSGRRTSYSRKIRTRALRMTLKLADRSDREIMERFFFEIAQGGKNKFDIVMTGAHREVVQCGAVISGSTIVCGQQISGSAIVCGQWITHDNYTFKDVYYVEDSLFVSDSLDENGDIEFDILQELD